MPKALQFKEFSMPQLFGCGIFLCYNLSKCVLFKETELMSAGSEIYSLCEKIFPICRSITGKGVSDTFELLNDYLKSNGCPEFGLIDVPT